MQTDPTPPRRRRCSATSSNPFHRTALGAVLCAFAVACATTAPDTPTGRVDVQIDQLNQIPLAAQRTAGGAPMQYRVRVANRGTGAITLQRITTQSVTDTDAYSVPTMTRSFDEPIPAREYRDIEYWVPARLNGNTITGNNGPVTLRLILHFDSPAGQFNEVVVRQVNTSRQGLQQPPGA